MEHADIALAVIGGTGVYRIAELERLASEMGATGSGGRRATPGGRPGGPWG